MPRPQVSQLNNIAQQMDKVLSKNSIATSNRHHRPPPANNAKALWNHRQLSLLFLSVTLAMISLDENVVFNALLRLVSSPQSIGMSSSSSPASTLWLPRSIAVLFLMNALDVSQLRIPYATSQNNFVNDAWNQSRTEFSFRRDGPLLSPTKRRRPSSRRTGGHHFVRRPSALDDLAPIPFQAAWLNDFGIAPHDATQDFGANHTIVPAPTHLPVPDYVDVYSLVPQRGGASLKELGQEARALIDDRLSKHGVLLFRNLHQVIQNDSDFGSFWDHVVNSGTNNNDIASNNRWNPMMEHLSCYNRKRQRLGNAVDRVDTDVPTVTIGPHNEQSCNPRPSDKIFFYAFQPAAVGGESLLRRNSDIVVPDHAQKLVQEAGGLQFTRSYPSQAQLEAARQEDRHPTEMSWQERTHTDQHELAREYFATQHGITNVTFDENDTLTAHTILPGFVRGEWFNRIDYGFPVSLANGEEFPLALQSQLKRQKWHEISAFKLEKGDWMVLDNLKVQHGRLPYQKDEGSLARKFLVTYTSSSP